MHAGRRRRTVKLYEQLPKCSHMMLISPVLVSVLSSYLPPSPPGNKHAALTPPPAGPPPPLSIWPLNSNDTQTLSEKLHFNVHPSPTGLKEIVKRSDHFCYRHWHLKSLCLALLKIELFPNSQPMTCWWSCEAWSGTEPMTQRSSVATF